MRGGGTSKVEKYEPRLGMWGQETEIRGDVPYGWSLTGLDYPFFALLCTTPVILIVVHTIILSFGNIRMIELQIFFASISAPWSQILYAPCFSCQS